MNIQEMRMLKEKLESSIAEELESFCRQTGLVVSDVRTEAHFVADASGKRMASPVYTAEVRVEL
jgi:hypothetical protein